MMRSFLVTVFALTALLATMAFAAAVPAPEANPDAEPGPYFYALADSHATVPFVNKKRDVVPPTQVKPREAFFHNRDADQLEVTFVPKLKSKRDLINVRPLLTRSLENMLVSRTLPNTPTSGPDARKCGLVAGYYCGSGNGACCGGPGSGVENMCGDTQMYCAGACQTDYGWCTDPTFQLAFDVDQGDVIWDPITDNVFEANLGDGMIYYGGSPQDPEGEPISWPSTL